MSPQVFLLGLAGPDGASVSGGTIDIDFAYIGPVGQPLDEPRPGPSTTATFRPVSGASEPSDGPRLAGGTDTSGVYATEPIAFPDTGYWEATATFRIESTSERVTAAFEVLDAHRVPAVGEPAPRTEHPVAGAPGVDPIVIDSRAGPATPVPDADLHTTTIAAAIAAGRPLTVVISTPAFCESRLCGPVTDAVAAVAASHRDRMDFVHLEVFADADDQRLNSWTAEWIARPGAEGNEPWVFVIDADGIIRHRFDNVANEALVEAAVTNVLAYRHLGCTDRVAFAAVERLRPAAVRHRRVLRRRRPRR
ncbi:MAG: hypothetical protein ACLGI3_03510 [Actinomycetes bacterium]